MSSKALESLGGDLSGWSKLGGGQVAGDRLKS